MRRKHEPISAQDLPRVTRDMYLDVAQFVQPQSVIGLAERVFRLPTATLTFVTASSGTAAAYLAWIGFLGVWLSRDQAAADVMPALILFAGSTAVLLHRLLPMTERNVLTVLSDEITSEISRAERETSTPPGYVQKLYELRLICIESIVQRQFRRQHRRRSEAAPQGQHT